MTKEARLNIRVYDQELKELKDWAVKDGVTLADLVRQMIIRERIRREQTK
jgi:predicted DNA binding CopG/RHH family protein